MEDSVFTSVLDELLAYGKECEWIEFKKNFHSADEIGADISAISNSIARTQIPFGYLVFGIEDGSNAVVGCNFDVTTKKVKNDDLLNYLMQRLFPRINVTAETFLYGGKRITLFRIPPAQSQPTTFNQHSYIRVNSITRKLRDFPEKEKRIWSIASLPFEKLTAVDGLSSEEIIGLLDTQSYFDLAKLPYPVNREGVISRFVKEKLVVANTEGYSITNLGALLFAKDLSKFETLKRKSVRFIIYKATNKISTIKDSFFVKGYASGFADMLESILNQLPQNEEISRALRNEIRMYPELGIRELLANTLIHQDLFEAGSPTVELYSDRIEFSNPGIPMITTDRFIDDYQSRNETIADLMRRLGICEEKGSGIDKLISQCELYQLPAPRFTAAEKRFTATMYAAKLMKDMDKQDRIRACYQHCCLKYVSNERMTNQSLRDRFKISEHNAAIASRIIADTKEEQLIKSEDSSNKSPKHAKYIPYWA